MFVAIAIPTEANEIVSDAARPWRDTLPAARWVPPRNRHVTLAFLGSTDQRLTAWVREQLTAVADATPPFQTRIRGFGAFPSTRRARVLWAGLDDETSAIAALAAAIRVALAARFSPGPHPFTAHLSIARCDTPLALPATFSQTQIESARFTVDTFNLMRSHLGGPAPVYEVVAGFPLIGSEHT